MENPLRRLATLLVRTPDDPALTRRRRVVGWTAAAALLVRLLYFREHGDSVFFGVPILDERFYDTVARTLLQGGDVAAVDPAFRPLLYPVLVALAYALGGLEGQGLGLGYELVLMLQHLAGVVTAGCIAALAIRLHQDWRAGAAAGALWVLAGPPLFFEGELLITTLFTSLLVWALVALTRCRVDGSISAWWWAGALIGLAALARANALVALVALPWLAAWPTATPVTRRRRAIWALSGWMAAAIVLSAGAWLQSRVTGQFQLLPSAGGVNLYLGNKRGADGRIPRQDQHASYGLAYRDSVQLFSVNAYRQATGDAEDPDPAEVSSYWTRRALDEVRADPWSWLQLMSRKASYLLWDREIPNNKAYHFVATWESPWLGRLPVTWGVLLGLATLGLANAWRRGDRHQLAAVLGLAVPIAAGILIFFVNGRFRLPLWPAATLLAGGGAILLIDLVRRRLRPSPYTVALLAAVAVGVGAFWPRPAATESFARDFFFRSIAHFERGHLDAARDDAERAIELEATDPAAWFQLGTVALAQGALERAQEAMLRASALEPSEPRIWNNLGVVLEKRGRMPEAYTAYIGAIRKGPGYAPAWVNAALLELRADDLDRAGPKILRAERLGDRSVHLQCARAFFEIKSGRLQLGEAILRGAAHRDADLVDRLVRDQTHPLHLSFGPIERPATP